MRYRAIVLMLFVSILFARDKVDPSKNRGVFGITASFELANYQNLAQSTMRYRGIGGSFQFDYTHFFPKGNELKGFVQGNIISYTSSVNEVSSFLLGGGKTGVVYNHLFEFTPHFSLVLGSVIDWQWQIQYNEHLNNNAYDAFFSNPFYLTLGGESRLGKDHPLRYTVGIALLVF